MYIVPTTRRVMRYATKHYNITLFVLADKHLYNIFNRMYTDTRVTHNLDKNIHTLREGEREKRVGKRIYIPIL